MAPDEVEMEAIDQRIYHLVETITNSFALVDRNSIHDILADWLKWQLDDERMILSKNCVCTVYTKQARHKHTLWIKMNILTGKLNHIKWNATIEYDRPARTCIT